MTTNGAHRPTDRERGFTLYLVLITMLVLAASFSTLANMSQRVPKQTTIESARAVALAAADGGIEWAIARVAKGVLDRATTSLDIGGTTVEVELRPILGAPEDPVQWHVRARAKCTPNGNHGLPVVRIVEARLSRPRVRGEQTVVTDWRAR